MVYLEYNKLEFESDYGYTGQNQACAFDANKGQVLLKSWIQIWPENSMFFKAGIIKTVVPLKVQASSKVFQFYKSGVLNSDECGTELDHTVAAVAFGKTDDGQEFFTIRNSWGTTWGEQGYVRIATKPLGKGICGV